MVLGLPVRSEARRSPVAPAIANMTTASETRDLSSDSDALSVTGAVSRYHKRIHTPSAKSPMNVLAYCKTANVGIHPTTGSSIQDCSQAQCFPGQVDEWVSESQSKCVATPRKTENAIAEKRAMPPNLKSPSWSPSLRWMPMGNSPAAGLLIAK